jgi:hypothetical protein
VCALDNRHVANFVCGVGVGASYDEHLRIVDYVAAHHALGKGSGAVAVGWVWASDPLEARDGEDVDIIIACCIWRETSAAIDVTGRISFQTYHFVSFTYIL